MKKNFLNKKSKISSLRVSPYDVDLVVSVPRFFSGIIKFGGISIVGNSWNLGSPLKKKPKLNISDFSSNLLNRSKFFIFNSKEEQMRAFLDLLSESGGGIAKSVPLGVSFLQKHIASEENRLVVSRIFFSHVGIVRNLLEETEIREAIKKLLDSNGGKKTIEEYRRDLESFTKLYGYYFIEKIWLEACIVVSWEILTPNSEIKSKLRDSVNTFFENSINYRVPDEILFSELKHGMDFIISAFEKTKIIVKTSIDSVGYIKGITSFEEADEIVKDSAKFIKIEEAATSKMLITSWKLLRPISNLFLNDAFLKDEYGFVQDDVFSKGRMSQAEWNDFGIYITDLSFFEVELKDIIENNKNEELNKINIDFESLKTEIYTFPQENISENWRRERKRFMKSLKSLKDRLKKFSL